MDYTLTRIDPNGENDRYPCKSRRIVTDPLEQEVNKTCLWAKLNDMVNWGRKTQFGRITSVFPAVTLRW